MRKMGSDYPTIKEFDYYKEYIMVTIKKFFF